MQENSLQVIASVQQKINQIAEEKRLLKNEIANLRKQIEMQQTELEEKNTTLVHLNEELKTVKMSQPTMNNTDTNEELKFKVEEMIKEIDKCIALLNN
jgi:chromosome segregation ATPase